MYINKKCDVIKILKKEYELLGWAIELKFLNRYTIYIKKMAKLYSIKLT